MMFKGQETENGNIVLIAQHRPGCLARFEAVAQLWLAKVMLAGLWFGLGFLVGLLFG